MKLQSCLLISALTVLCFAGGALAGEKPPVVVGVSVPLTGDAASIGVAVKNGVELAYSELEPELQKRISLSYQDDQNSQKNAVTAFTKLVKGDKASVIITCASNTSKTTAPLADREKVPQISIATDTAVSEGRKYAMNFWATAGEEAKPAVAESLRRGYKKIAIISAVHDFTQSCRKAFEAENAGRVSVALSEEFAPDSRDFKTFLTKLRSIKDVDAIFVNLFLGQIGLFAKQARQMGVNQPLFTFELFEEANEVKNSEGALIGQWYVQADDPNSEYTNKYAAKFPGAPTLGSANGYDAVKLIAESIRLGKDSSEAINDYLHSVKDFSGALGTFSANANGTFSLPTTLKVVTKTGFEKLK